MSGNFFKGVSLTLLLIGSGCAKDGQSFSLLADSQFFKQEVTSNNKVDVVWVVDDSGTMVNHQANLAANFGHFIPQFVDKGFDYRMVVASTDSWLREMNYNGGSCSTSPNPTHDPNKKYVSSADCANTLATFGQMTQFRDGDIFGTAAGVPGVRSGKYLISSLMNPADAIATFATNVKVGTRGDGSRESAFQSLRAVLRRNADGTLAYNGETHTVLSQFRRDDAFLAVIVISDEEDQSKKADGTNYASTDDWKNSFITFLDSYTGGKEGNRNYNFSGIFLSDMHNCSYALNAEATVSARYVAMAQATRGIVGNICDADFSTQLQGISDRIVSLATRFRLSREPVPSTIKVSVNGNSILEDEKNGWTYLRETDQFQYIEFHGTAVPPEGATIGVDFDPVTAKN